MTAGEIIGGRTRATSALMLLPAILVALVVVGVVPDLLQRLMRMARLDQKLNLAWQNGLITLVLFGLLIVAALLWGLLAQTKVLAAGRVPLKAGAMGLAIGVFGLLIATGYAALAGGLHWVYSYVNPRILLLLAGTILTFYQCAGEEIFFRGWIQPMLVRGWGRWAGVGVTSLFFALLHLFAGVVHSPLAVVNVVLAGLLFGLLAIRTGGLIAPIAAHFAWDWSEGILLGLYPNPGVDVWGSLWNLDLIGSPLWGGSAEGLNGSLGVTFVLLALCVPLAKGLIVPAPQPEAA